ncbi:hypothetical protein [Eisenibacter elegans]|uniref:hypothetical protein n=1 Tax=Eisenibacter elegans TaxID=997 RepID=UPI000419378C|nr:hypothetical protein [Eisenibacter elegans]
MKQAKTSAPIIFIHYGNSPYLKYTLRSAQLSNPDKEVVLLGDADNQHLRQMGISHYLLENYAQGKEIELFHQVYRHVAGKKHMAKTFADRWLKFVFERWFMMYTFIKTKDIQQFWTFDSDNLLLSSLAQFESQLSAYDCTTQCMDTCMNGLINNQKVVKGYIDKINELFQRETYLAQQQEEFDTKHPDYAFTEMRAFKIYRDETDIQTFRLQTIVDQSAFDECVACTHHEMRMHPQALSNGQKMKQLFINAQKEVFSYYEPEQRYIKLHNLNMSWIPQYLTKRVYDYVFEKPLRFEHAEELKLIPVNEPIGVSIQRQSMAFWNKGKRRLLKIISK